MPASGMSFALIVDLGTNNLLKETKTIAENNRLTTKNSRKLTKENKGAIANQNSKSPVPRNPLKGLSNFRNFNSKYKTIAASWIVIKPIIISMSETTISKGLTIFVTQMVRRKSIGKSMKDTCLAFTSWYITTNMIIKIENFAEKSKMAGIFEVSP